VSCAPRLGGLVRLFREDVRHEHSPFFVGWLVRMEGGRPVIFDSVRIPWDSPGLVLDVRLGRQGVEGGTHEDALVLFPEGLCRVPESSLRTLSA
jgi:hypothetical protein